jgi:hypothetical protein
MLWMMFLVCLLTMSAVQSDSSGTNDLGFRGILVVQFVLLIWAAPIVHDVFFLSGGVVVAGLGVGRWIKASLILTLVLGAAGTTYQLLALRCYAPMVEGGKITPSEHLIATSGFLDSKGFAERTYWIREGFGRLNTLTRSTALVQYNPVGNQILNTHLYSTRQTAIGDRECGSTFGGDLQVCKQVYPYVAALFNSPDTVRNWNLDSLCDGLHIDVLVATDVDPAWQDPYGWVWTRPTLIANPSMRAIPCGMTSVPPVAQ